MEPTNILELQDEMEKVGTNFYYDNYFKNIEGLEGWKSISFHKATKGGKDGCVIYISNPSPYIEIEVREQYHSQSSYILIGKDVWYPKTQRTATDAEAEKAISFFKKKIAERKYIIARAKNNPNIDAIKRDIYNKFNAVNTNDKISVSRNLQFFNKDNGLIGYMEVSKNDFNEARIKMVYPNMGETFPVSYFTNGLTDHYYGKEESWEDFFRHCL